MTKETQCVGKYATLRKISQGCGEIVRSNPGYGREYIMPGICVEVYDKTYGVWARKYD